MSCLTGSRSPVPIDVILYGACLSGFDTLSIIFFSRGPHKGSVNASLTVGSEGGAALASCATCGRRGLMIGSFFVALGVAGAVATSPVASSASVLTPVELRPRWDLDLRFLS